MVFENYEDWRCFLSRQKDIKEVEMKPGYLQMIGWLGCAYSFTYIILILQITLQRGSYFILYTRKLGIRKVRWFIKVYRVSKWQSWDLNPNPSDSEPIIFPVCKTKWYWIDKQIVLFLLPPASMYDWWTPKDRPEMVELSMSLFQRRRVRPDGNCKGTHSAHMSLGFCTFMTSMEFWQVMQRWLHLQLK